MRILLHFWMIFLCTITLLGCIGKVEWVQRPGGMPEEQHWLPVCPHCREIVNYDALQCSNPNCRQLLAWSDHYEYAPHPYQPTLASIPASTNSMPIQKEEISNSKPPANNLVKEEPIQTPSILIPDAPKEIETKQNISSRQSEISPPEQPSQEKPLEEDDPWQIKEDDWD